MRNLKNLLLIGLMSIVGFALLTGCKRNKIDDKVTPPAVEKDAAIVLAKTTVSASVSGGPCLLGYTITNGDAHPGEKISATAAEDWVSDFDSSSTGALRFTVAANNSDAARECLVTVSYRYAEDVTFTVKQGSMSSDGFSVEKVGDGTEYFSYTVNVYPENKQLPYIMMSASESYIIGSGLESDEALYEDDFSYFEYLGKFHGMSAVEVMWDRAKMGDQYNVTVGEGTPGDKCIFYCYYFDYDSGALISDIYRFEIEIDHPKMSDLAAGYFDFSKTVVEGPLVKAEVTSSTDVDYYFDIMTEKEIDDAVEAGYTKEEYVKLWWANIVAGLKHKEGYSTSDIVAQNTCQGTDSKTGRPRSQWNYDLLADSSYYIFAFNMDENALCVTTPQFYKVTTGSVEPSPNQLEITVASVTTYSVALNIAATYKEYTDAYVSNIATRDEWNTYGKNDTERMNYIKTHIPNEYMWGSNDVKYSPLEPDTEYVAYAFGLYGGVVTTQLWTTEFKTKSDKPGNVDIFVEDLGYYDPADLSKIEGFEFLGGDSYAGKAFVPIHITFSSKNHGDYIVETYDWTGRNDEYDDENYMAHLVWMIETDQNMTATDTYTMLDWNGDYTMFGAVVDKNGQYSKLFKRKINPTYSGATTDLTKVKEWWNGWHEDENSGAELQSLVISDAPAIEKNNANVIEVDMSKPRLKVESDMVKASERPFKANFAEPAVDALTATR